MTTAGLRETKKAATRQALAVAVLRLSARDGFDTVSVEAVAAAVGVSPRTFHNYFAGKEEALRFYLTEVIDRVFTALEARPSDEPFWDSTAAAFIDVICDGVEDPQELVHLMTVMDTEPTLAMKKPGAGDDADPIVERFAELCRRRSVGPQGVMHSKLILGCAAICVRVALEEQAEHDSAGVDLRETLQRTFDQVKNGLGAAVPAS